MGIYIGKYVYLKHDLTPSNSVLPNWQLYRKYKKSGINQHILLGPQRYWQPHLPDNNIILEYNDDVSVPELEKRNTTTAETTSTVYKNNPTFYNGKAGDQIKLGGAVYIATDLVVPFSRLATNRPNPYKIQNEIRVWIKSGAEYANTLETGTLYWYDPVLPAFLVIPRLFSAVASTISELETKKTSQELAAQSIREGRILAAMATGKTRQQAENQIAASDAGKKTVTGSSGNTQQAAGGNNSNSSANTAGKFSGRTTVKVRGNFGYVGIGARLNNQPQMVQQFIKPGDTFPQTARHIFNLEPNQINYSNLGSNWEEIDRSGQVPLVDWKNYKLMKISFQFLVVPDAGETAGRLGGFSNSTTNTQITVGIDSKLRNLRAMATRPYPVILFGFDDMMTNQLRFPSDAGRGVEFVIQDFSISSMFRTENGEINRATCDITLQEVPLETIRLIEMPKLIPTKDKPGDDEDEPEYGSSRLLTTDSTANIDRNENP